MLVARFENALTLTQMTNVVLPHPDGPPNQTTSWRAKHHHTNSHFNDIIFFYYHLFKCDLNFIFIHASIFLLLPT